MMSKKMKLIPKLRFSEFKNSKQWNEVDLNKLANRVLLKNRDSLITTVFSNSAIDGIVDQREYFDKDIANKNNLENYYVVEPNDYVYNPRISSLAPVGPLFKNKTNKSGAMSPLYTVFRFNEKDNEFYEYYFKSRHWHDSIRKVANTGARFDRISITDSTFMEISVLFPEPKEQQKIASCLSSIDELIAAHSDKLETLKDHKKGLMQNLFPQKGQRVPNYRFPEFEKDGEWVLNELSNCADVVDPHPSHRAPTAVNNCIPFIGIGDISEDGVLDTKNVRQVPKEILLEHNERYQLKVGDFAYGRVASVGKVVDLSKNIDKKYTYSPTMAIIQPKEVDASFLRHFCNSNYFINQVVAKTSGSTRKSIGMQNLRILKVCMPSSDNEQQKIASCLSSLDEIITAQSEKIEQLQQHKKGLMQGLFPNTSEVR